MSEKAALAELYNGRPENYGNVESPIETSLGNEPSSSHQEQQSISPHEQAPELPTYHESESSFHHPTQASVSIRVASPPPRPPPPDLNRLAPLPMLITTQPHPTTTLQAHTATVIVNPPAVQPQPVIHQPNGTAHLLRDDSDRYFTDRPRPFSSGLFNCCVECQPCVCGTFCSCCYLAALASKIGESTLTGLCCMAGLAPLRTKLRLMHNIHGSICEDIVMSMCCNFCVVCQMGREMNMLKYPTKCCCC